jgi:ribonuclease R
MITETRVLRHIERLPNRTAGYKQLVRELSVRGAERRELERLLKELVQRGKLVETSRDRYSLPGAASKHNLVSGRLTMHRDGYGFVIPESAELREKISGDIYINPTAIGAAMHGDQVLVELGTRRNDGRAEGRIVRVVGRKHPTVVGTFHYGQRYNYVTPIDEKITLDVIIPKGMEWPGETGEEASNEEEQTQNPRPSASRGGRGTEKVSKRKLQLLDRDRVIGTEAKRREWDDLENLVVDVEITEWPTTTQNPKGRVLEILGYEDDFGVDVEIIIRKHHIPHKFPLDVLDEAQSIEPIIPAKELKGRRDFRSLPIVTIDGETARDFDDAVIVHRLDRGNFELQVHIADVAHYVREGEPLDNEARMRGTSVYFPDRAVPMLPMELSTDICSLRPKVDRLVMSCVMEIDNRGEVVGYEVMPGVIRSAERMTYTDVHAILEGDATVRKKYAHLVENFELMKELAEKLNEKRKRRGSIDFDLPEPVIEWDENGLMKGVTRSERNFAHRLIEEFMLAANESVASYLENKQVASLYRIHEKPDPKRVFEFENMAAAFGYSLGVGALPVKRMQMKSDRRGREGGGRARRQMVELPEDIHITPRMYQKLTEKIAGKREERILSFLMLRSLKQAKYSEVNEGHFALAAPSYTHFTSPIRRYPDLIVHRILKEVLADSAEERDGAVPVGVGGITGSETPSPWSKRKGSKAHPENPHVRGSASGRGARERDGAPKSGPIPEEVLHDIAVESSQSERRADEAERELLEWKKLKFMAERVGEEFDGLIISVTKFGMFVELNELFIEGLVPLSSLTDDRYIFNDSTKQIIGQRTRKQYSLGDAIRVLVDRIDRMQRRIQFAIVEEAPSRAKKKHKKR